MCCTLLQVFHPDKFQAFVLGQRGNDTVVQAPRQLAFTDFYMPANAALTKDVFAEEASGTITQGLAQEGGYTAFGEQQRLEALLHVPRHKRLHGSSEVSLHLAVWQQPSPATLHAYMHKDNATHLPGP